MASNLFSALGGAQAFTGRMGNMANIISQFNQFKNSFQGDPKQQVQQLLNSGRMSQQQYNQLSQLATQFQKLL